MQGADVDRAREVMLRTAAQEQAAEERWEGVVLEEPGGLGRQRDHSTAASILRLAIKRRTAHDDFDRALRERILLALDAIGVQQFPVTTVVQSEPAPGQPAPRPAAKRRTNSELTGTPRG